MINKKTISFILAIILILIAWFMLNQDEKENNNNVADYQVEDTSSWEFYTGDLTEEEFELFTELGEEGLSIIERIKIIKPEEYEKIKDDPFIMEMLKEE